MKPGISLKEPICFHQKKLVYHIVLEAVTEGLERPIRTPIHCTKKSNYYTSAWWKVIDAVGPVTRYFEGIAVQPIKQFIRFEAFDNR